MLNCVRLITRILPFVFELESDAFEIETFWTGEDPLARRIVVLSTKLLFCRGFTIPFSNLEDATRIHYIIWSKGIGASSAPPASKDEILRRTEVLRLLLTLLSKTMYSTQSTVRNQWASEIVEKVEKKAILGMLCSFVNTISQYDPNWASLPYSNLLFGDVNEPLVSICSQCLVAIFDNVPSEIQSAPALKGSESIDSVGSLNNLPIPQNSSTALGTNLFTYYFSKLYKQVSLPYI